MQGSEQFKSKAREGISEEEKSVGERILTFSLVPLTVAALFAMYQHRPKHKGDAHPVPAATANDSPKKHLSPKQLEEPRFALQE